MPIPQLLKEQSNKIVLAMKERGFDVDDFTVKDERNVSDGVSSFTTVVRRVFLDFNHYTDNLLRHRQGIKITHKNSNFYFYFKRRGANKYLNKFYYGWTADGEFSTFPPTDNWQTFYDHFCEWLTNLSIYESSPDLWEDKSKEKESELIEGIIEDNENSTFTESEQEEIDETLKELKQYFLDTHQIKPEIVEPRIEFLRESSKRLGRKDWKHAFLGTVLSIVILGGVAGHKALEYSTNLFHKVLSTEKTLLAPMSVEHKQIGSTPEKVVYQDMNVKFYSSSILRDFGQFWMIESILGSDFVHQYLKQNDPIISKEVLEKMFEAADIKFYTNQDNTRIYSEAGLELQKFYGDKVHDKPLSPIDAVSNYDLAILENASEKGTSKVFPI